MDRGLDLLPRQLSRAFERFARAHRLGLYWRAVGASPRHRLRVLPFLLAVGGCGPSTLFISTSELPEGADWIAVVALSSDGRFLRASGLSRIEDGPLELPGEPLEPKGRAVVLGFAESELNGRVESEETRRKLPLRVATEIEAALPEPLWQVGRAADEEALAVERPRLPFTSDALIPCPPVGSPGSPGVFQIDCATAPCVPNVVQRGCHLELDFRSECGAGRVRGRLDARAGFAPEATSEWFGACAPTPAAPGAFFSLDCREGGERKCGIQGRPAANSDAVSMESLTLVPGAPERASPEDPERLGGSIIPLGEDQLVLFGPPGGGCPAGGPRTLYFVSRPDFSVAGTATVTDCLRHLGLDPVTGGLIGISLSPLAWVRLDTSGRVTERRPIALQHPHVTPAPLAVAYHPASRRWATSFGEPQRDDRRHVEYVSFDADTLARSGGLVVDRPRAEFLAVAWGEVVVLDDDREALRFVTMPDFEDRRAVILAPETERKNHVRLAFFPSIDRVLIRVAGRSRSIVQVDRQGAVSRAFNFETTSLPYSFALAPWDAQGGVLVGLVDDDLQGSGYLSLLRPYTAQFEPGLMRVEGDGPYDLYSDEREPYVYVILRRTGRLLRVRATAD